jgi:hypothetical protein
MRSQLGEKRSQLGEKCFLDGSWTRFGLHFLTDTTQLHSPSMYVVALKSVLTLDVGIFVASHQC